MRINQLPIQRRPACHAGPASAWDSSVVPNVARCSCDVCWVIPVALTALMMSLAGCSDTETGGPSTPAETPVPVTAAPSSNTPAGTRSSSVSASDDGGVVEFKPLPLSGLPDSSANNASGAGTAKPVEVQIREIITALQPMQVLLGQWRGTTRREYENFKAVDSHEWVWDLRTQPDSPALVVASDKSPYLRSARVSWSPVEQQFVMTAKDADGTERTFHGTFTDPPHEIVGSDDKLHRVYRLEFNQDEATQPAGGELWQLAFVQQENNRYLLEVGRRRGTAPFSRFDTVSTQREGTSFAISDSGYAEKTCIISEGLGTMEVTWKGRSYWVCCTGCKAAFEDDPETWIARAAEKAKAESK